MGAIITRLDIFSLSVFPEMYKNKQTYGSFLGVFITICFIALIYPIYLSYDYNISYDNWKW